MDANEWIAGAIDSDEEQDQVLGELKTSQLPNPQVSIIEEYRQKSKDPSVIIANKSIAYIVCNDSAIFAGKKKKKKKKKGAFSGGEGLHEVPQNSGAKPNRFERAESSP
jgi:hypothetical protein